MSAPLIACWWVPFPREGLFFPAWLGLLFFFRFINIGSNSPVSAQDFYQSRMGAGRGAGAVPGTGVLLPTGLNLVQLLGGG